MENQDPPIIPPLRDIDTTHFHCLLCKRPLRSIAVVGTRVEDITGGVQCYGICLRCAEPLLNTEQSHRDTPTRCIDTWVQAQTAQHPPTANR